MPDSCGKENSEADIAFLRKKSKRTVKIKKITYRQRTKFGTEPRTQRIWHAQRRVIPWSKVGRKCFPTRYRLPLFLPRLPSSELCRKSCPVLTYSIVQFSSGSPITEQFFAACKIFMWAFGLAILTRRISVFVSLALKIRDLPWLPHNGTVHRRTECYVDVILEWLPRKMRPPK